MNRRREITLGGVLFFAVWLLVSCGGGATVPPTPAPGVTLSPASLTFTGQLVGTTSTGQAVTVTNSGNAALSVTGVAISGSDSTDFAQTNTCTTSSIAAGSTCTITVTFTPTAAGSRSASVTITDNASGSPQSVALSGTGTAPAVTLSTATLTFTGQLVGTTSAAQTVTLTNSGTASLAVATASLGGTNPGDFAKSADTCTGANVAASATCTVSITFTPTATGSRAATLTFTDNAGAAAGSTQTVALSGTGTAPAVTLSPTTITFASQLQGTTSAAQTVTVTNSGTATLTISALSLGGANPGDFATSADKCTGANVAPSGTCTVNVTFTPTAAGSRTASLAFADNAAGSPQSVPLTGTGTAAPIASLSVATLTFPSQIVGTTSSTMMVTLNNTGSAALTVTGVAISGTNSPDFAQTNTCTTSSVAAGANCTISVTFTPSINGAESATLTVTDNSLGTAGSTQTVALSGTGATFPTVSGSVTKGAVSGATVTIYLVNSDGSSGTVLGTGTTASDGSFSITLTVSPTGPVRVSVTGGTYPSEWDGATITSSSSVTALLDDVSSGATGISVTAASTFVDSFAAGSLAHGTSTSITSAHAAGEALIISYYGFTITVTIETLAPTFTGSSIGTDGFKLGLIVGTLSEEGSSLNSTDPDSLIASLAADISDGVWNGLVFGATIPLGTSGVNLPATAGTSDFSSSLGTYASSGTGPNSPPVNGITSSTPGFTSAINTVDTGVATCTCTPAAVGLAATSSGAINSLAFTPSNTTSSHQFAFIAARTSGVVAVDITNPTLTAPPVKVWQQLYVNQPGSGGFGSIDVGGVIPFVGTAGHPQLLALAYGSKHILILNANTLVTGTPWTDNPVDAEMDVPIKATAEVEFSGGAAYIGSGVPLGGSLLALATADGYMIFDASLASSSESGCAVGSAGCPVLDVYTVQDPTEIIAENLGGDPVHHYLLGGNESTCEGFGCPGGVQLVDLSTGVTNGTSYYITPANFPTIFPGTPTGNSVDANSVDPALQVAILTFEDTQYAELVNMSNITKTLSTTPGVLNSWDPASGGSALITFGVSTYPIISGSAVDSTTHLAYFMAGYSDSMAVGQIQNPASVPAGTAWSGLSDWSFGTITDWLTDYSYATDPHADGVVYNLMENTPYAYELNGSDLSVVQTDMAGFLAIPRAATTGDGAHQPGTNPTTVTNTATGGVVMQEFYWTLPLGITSTTFPIGYVGSSYSVGLTAVNGTAPYTWSTDAAGTTTLSTAGLTLNSASATISGTPTTVGTYTFTLTVTDSSTPAETASVSVTIIIDATPPAITTSSLTAATEGTAYSATLTETGGLSPYTWSITSGALPAGLALAASTGVISGTPTVAGVFNFTVTVTDSSPSPQTASQALSLTVNNPTALSVPSTITLASGSIYSGYDGNLESSFTGGTPPFTCSLTSGTLPAGLSLDTNNCAIVGVPTATGTATVGISVTDSNSVATGSGSTMATLTINAATNNAELTGQYTFVINGWDTSGYALVWAGSFTADGKGDITAGSLDVNDSLSTPATLTFTGNFGVGPDNRGGMVITDSNSNVHTLLFSLGTLSSGVSTKAHVELFDTTDGTASGNMVLQDATAFSTSALTSTYTFGIVGGYDGRLTGGGVFTADGSGDLTAGESDIDNDSEIFAAAPFTGSYSVPTSGLGTTNGRGTGSFTMTLPTGTATVNFAFYVVSATQLYLVSTDSSSVSPLGSVFSGAAVAQTGGPFSNSSLNGISVFSTAGGNTSSSPPTSDVQAGLLTLDGTGGFTLSSNENNGGTVTSDSITGNYNVATNGRVELTETSGAASGTLPPVLYLQAPGTGVIIGTDAIVDFGAFEPQAAAPSGGFTNAGFSGNYFFGTRFGHDPVYGTKPESGVVTSDGVSSITGTDDSSKVQNGVIQLRPGRPISGTYSVAANGQVTLTSGSGGGGMVFYIVSSTKAIGVDTSTTDYTPTIIVVEQ